MMPRRITAYTASLLLGALAACGRSQPDTDLHTGPAPLAGVCDRIPERDVHVTEAQAHSIARTTFILRLGTGATFGAPTTVTGEIRFGPVLSVPVGCTGDTCAESDGPIQGTATIPLTRLGTLSVTEARSRAGAGSVSDSVEERYPVRLGYDPEERSLGGVIGPEGMDLGLGVRVTRLDARGIAGRWWDSWAGPRPLRGTFCAYRAGAVRTP